MSEVVKKDCQNPNMLGQETQYMYAGNFESFRKFYENILILSLRSTPFCIQTANLIGFFAEIRITQFFKRIFLNQFSAFS